VSACARECVCDGVEVGLRERAERAERDRERQREQRDTRTLRETQRDRQRGGGAAREFGRKWYANSESGSES
jgi:hypothetical protein